MPANRPSGGGRYFNNPKKPSKEHNGSPAMKREKAEHVKAEVMQSPKSDKVHKEKPAPSPRPSPAEAQPTPAHAQNSGRMPPHEKKFTQRSRLFVGNLPLGMGEDAFKGLFTRFGEISETFINSDKGFGFVRMDTRANAEKAKWELDGTLLKNRPLRVRFATHGAALSVKNLSPYVSNELLGEAFSQFGQVERAIVIVDDRGRSTEKGIVEFARKSAAMKALQQIKDGCFLLTSSPRAIVACQREQEDSEDGLQERNMQKSPQFFQEREAPPRFAQPGTFEEEFARRWKALDDLEREQREQMEKSIQGAKEKLETEMENAIHEHKTMLMKQDLMRRQEELQRLEDARKRELDRRQQLEMAREEARKKELEEMHHRQDMLRAQIEGSFKQDPMGFPREFARSENSQAQAQAMLHDVIAQEMMGGQGGLGPAPVLSLTAKVRYFHHTQQDMQRLLGNYNNTSSLSQKFYRLAFKSCSSNICSCKGAENILVPADDIFTRLIPCPKSVDCQTFGQWKQHVALSKFNRQLERFKTNPPQLKLCLLPVGPFPDFIKNFQIPGRCKSLWALLADSLRIFFTGSTVEVLPERDISQMKVQGRIHDFTKKHQYLVTDFFPILKSEVPKDSFCIVAVTWDDLYPCKDLNFVLGQASFHHYCCVASFGRFDPTYLRGFKGNTEGITADDMKDITSINAPALWKLVKVLIHETCHVFGLNHCAMFACLMNASCSSEEALNQPLLLCPLCMRKIHHACSMWPTTKNLFEINSHLASMWQFLKFIFESLPGSTECQITSDRLNSTLHLIESLLNI
uniref:Uncharacterized protein LOC100184998 n=1 Tax=Phallusia mammillata TaxID=59560 RepID=A0A6F9DIE0_9ASCI|nr:uncharacterized protein LOC100184998 [Phallusia mammillata]